MVAAACENVTHPAIASKPRRAHDRGRNETPVLHTEERSVRIATVDGLAVDGVVRTRRFELQRRAFRMRFEQLDPVAVAVERHGHTERIALRDGGASATRLAWLAMPVAAGITARMLRSRRKKGA